MPTYQFGNYERRTTELEMTAQEYAVLAESLARYRAHQAGMNYDDPNRRARRMFDENDLLVHGDDVEVALERLRGVGGPAGYLRSPNSHMYGLWAGTPRRPSYLT